MDEQEFFDDLTKIVMDDAPVFSERTEKLLGINDYNMLVMLNLYISLICKGVTLVQLFNCVVTNRLDKLIHRKNTFDTSDEYVAFNNDVFEIGPTYDKELSPDEKMLFGSMKILVDDRCPSCKRVDYLKKKLDEVCSKCGKCVCIECVDSDNHECYIHSELEMQPGFNQGIIERIQIKIFDAKKKDKMTFRRAGNITVKDVCTLIERQRRICAVCKDPVLLDGYAPYCQYQFTIDRKNNSFPHDRDNCQISCYYCNCRIWNKHNEGVDKLKTCKMECHTKERKLLTKYEVPRY